jgi:hypothetical protein
MSSLKKCKVVGCKSKRSDGLCLFGIPQKEEAKKSWFQFLVRSGWQKSFNINSAYEICEQHFEERFIKTGSSNRKRLTSDAIPTIFNVNFKLLTTSCLTKLFLNLLGKPISSSNFHPFPHGKIHHNTTTTKDA